MLSAYIYMNDLALEKCRQYGNQIDLVLMRPGIQKRPSKWDAQYVEPSQRLGI
ncbi:MAG: hypothetical protein A4E48_00290 [Methanosaeta sp. PtaU1.Bin060]|nr:MAG: hypothetical protein A4E48_00290 [Methanosaeta sp. PtaU1.Bin060]